MIRREMSHRGRRASERSPDVPELASCHLSLVLCDAGFKVTSGIMSCNIALTQEILSTCCQRTLYTNITRQSSFHSTVSVVVSMLIYIFAGYLLLCKSIQYADVSVSCIRDFSCKSETDNKRTMLD